MRLATMTCLAVVLAMGCGGGIALVADNAGAPVDSSACKAAWSIASPNGEALSEDKAVDYIINFTAVDTDKNGQISADEFIKGCEKGLAKAGNSTIRDMG
jgi:hypothetical protein